MHMPPGAACCCVCTLPVTRSQRDTTLPPLAPSPSQGHRCPVSAILGRRPPVCQGVVLVQYIGDTLLALAGMSEFARVLVRGTIAEGPMGLYRIVDVLPGTELPVERDDRPVDVPDLIEFLRVGALRPLDRTVELWGARRRNKAARPRDSTVWETSLKLRRVEIELLSKQVESTNAALEHLRHGRFRRIAASNRN